MLATIAIWMAAAIMLGFGGGQWIIRIWSGGRSVPSASLMWWMIAFGFGQSCAIAAATLLSGVGRLTSQLIGGALMVIVGVPLGIYLCRRVGPSGVAISQTIVSLAIAMPAALYEIGLMFRAADAKAARGIESSVTDES